MNSDYYIVYNPLIYNLMDIIDEVNISPIEIISYITNLDAKKITTENYIDYLQFDLNKHRESMVETFAIESYSAQYIGNMIGRNASGEKVIHSDDKRRTIRDIILEFGKKPKGVFITSMSPNFPSAVALSIILNVGKIPVILGGIHVSVSPEDVDIFIRKYCPNPDLISQVIGAGDSKVIPEILQDLNSELLKSEYRGERGIENSIWKRQSNVEYLEPMRLEALKDTPIIGRFLSKMKIIPVAPFLGCPHSCTFCSISAIPKNQRKFSIRSADDFLDELEHHQKNNSFDSRFFFFLPDNLLFGKKYLIKILDGIIQRKLKVNFATQISIDVASDINLLAKLRMAGATHFFIGLESLDVGNLEFIQKHILKDIKKSGLSPTEYYSKQVKTIQNYGISIHGAFIFGLPFDYFHNLDDNTGVDTALFCRENRIGLQPASLTDLPGSINFKDSQKKDTWIYGKQATMKYLLSLCLTDLTEINRVPPGDLNLTPLTVVCMAYEAIQRCASPMQSLKNGIYMFYKSLMSPTFRGKSSIKERIIDAMYSFVSQIIVSSYKLHGERVAFSNSEVRGSFERLFDIEKDKDKRDLLKEYVEQFKFTPNRI